MYIFSGKKDVVNLLSAELAQRVVKFKKKNKQTKKKKRTAKFLTPPYIVEYCIPHTYPLFLYILYGEQGAALYVDLEREDILSTRLFYSTSREIV